MTRRLQRLSSIAVVVSIGAILLLAAALSPPGRGGRTVSAAPAGCSGVAYALALVTRESSGCAPGASEAPGSNSTPPPLSTPYEVLGSYPHDPQAFLQGLVWHEGGFYESTGLHGRSSLRRVEFPSGDVVQQVVLPDQYFGEGLALVGERLIQLTWRSKRGFVYERASLALLGDFPYETEGWGLTYDGVSLIMSDGTDVLTFLDSDSYQPIRTLAVTLDERPLRDLNELEWIEGEIWANVWQTDLIARIDPSTGRVNGVVNLAGLLPGDQRTGQEDVLNGIAYDAVGKRIFVGGKLWPRLFEIRIS